MEAGAALFAGSSGDNEPHRHHAVQVVVGLEHQAKVELPGNAPGQAEALVIPPDIPHALCPGLVGLLYLEPESVLGAALARAADNHAPVYQLSEQGAEKLRARFHSSTEWDHPESLTRHLVEDIVPVAALPDRVVEVDQRVRAALDIIDGHLASPPPLSELARAAGASERHLRTLFRSQVGLSIKRYRLWSKLRAALALHLAGADLTSCAHSAGFSDAAHFTRTFREMFGTTPTNALRELAGPKG